MKLPPIHVQGIGLIGPGLADWPQAAAVLRGEAPLTAAPVPLPPPALLPATERRRAGSAIRLSMHIGLEAVGRAGADAARLPNVFSSTGGDCENCHALLDTLASADRMVSPTRFHNSVHNAPAGYWCIATHCTEASTSLCAYDATFGAGLLETATQALTEDKPCLLIAFDTPYPEPLNALRPIPYPFGVALVLGPRRTPATLAALELALTDAPADTLTDPALETLRRAVPAARSLPLLQRLARQAGGDLVLDYLDGRQLAVGVAA